MNDELRQRLREHPAIRRMALDLANHAVSTGLEGSNAIFASVLLAEDWIEFIIDNEHIAAAALLKEVRQDHEEALVAQWAGAAPRAWAAWNRPWIRYTLISKIWGPWKNRRPTCEFLGIRGNFASTPIKSGPSIGFSHRPLRKSPRPKRSSMPSIMRNERVRRQFKWTG